MGFLSAMRIHRATARSRSVTERPVAEQIFALVALAELGVKRRFRRSHDFFLRDERPNHVDVDVVVDAFARLRGGDFERKYKEKRRDVVGTAVFFEDVGNEDVVFEFESLLEAVKLHEDPYRRLFRATTAALNDLTSEVAELRRDVESARRRRSEDVAEALTKIFRNR